MRNILEKAKYIIREEGLTTFLKRGFLFIRHSLVFNRTYYIYEGRLKEINSKAEKTEVKDLAVRIISGNEEFAQLSLEGFVFKSWKPEYRDRLNRGAISYCAFIDKQLVHVSWTAATEDAMRSLDEPPYYVDFAGGEISIGDYWTHPDYRGKGIAYAVTNRRRQYLIENGIETTCGSIRKDNRPSLRVTRFGDTYITATGRHRRILFWQSWKETPVDAGDKPGQ